MPNRMFAILGLVLALLPTTALAGDWVAVKLRGQVLQFIDGQWAEIDRGDVVPDDRIVRTGATGRVEFRRDKESISLGADTQVQIHDRTGERFTTLEQRFGTVEVEAEVRNVRHFAVETPLLAAVVKGTRFVVSAGKAQASVEVKRGKVEVTDSHTGAHALVPKGQTATVSAGGGFVVEGRGARTTPIIGANGEIVVSAPAAAGSPTDGRGVAIGVSAPGGVGAGVSAGASGVEVDASVGDVAEVSASAGSAGVSAGASVGNTVTAGVGAGSGGVTAGASVGGTSVGVSVGGGGVSLSLGGKKLL